MKPVVLIDKYKRATVNVLKTFVIVYSKYFVFVVYVNEDVNKSFLIEFPKLEIGLAAQLFTVGGLWNVSGHV